MQDSKTEVIKCLKLLKDHYFLESNSMVFPNSNKVEKKEKTSAGGL